MRFLAIILFSNVIALFDVCGQVITDGDISFKARLLTINRSGLASSEIILKDILDQPTDFLKKDSSNIIVVKVKFNQKNFRGNDRELVWVGECNFYVAFSKRTYKFYRIGGFDVLDLHDFFKDLEPSDYISVMTDEKLNREIDILCLRKASRHKCKRKSKKATTCAKKCSDVLSEYITIH